jgi:cytochrome P450
MRTMMEMFALPFVNFRMRLPLPRTQRFKHARRRLDAVIYDLIARRRRDGSDRTDALSMLLAARDAETGYQPSEGQIRDEVVTLFGAGHETTASLLTWTLYLLAQNPQIDERMGIAVRDGDREFILRVVRETLRLYPPAWLIGRETRQDVTLIDGTTIPAKTAIFISPLLLHRRPEYFPDPLRFDPDRWLGPEPPQFAYVPFGGGARRCIGEDFTWNEAAIVLQTLLRRYSFALEPNAHVEAQASASLRPAGPVMMRPRERIAVEAPALN